MAELKRNRIELFKEMKDDEPVMESFLTSPFMPMSVILEANDMLAKHEGKELGTMKAQEMREFLDDMADFVAKRVYNNQFTKQDIFDRLHSPDAISELQQQIAFVALGIQSNETKKFLAKKR